MLYSCSYSSLYILLLYFLNLIIQEYYVSFILGNFPFTLFFSKNGPVVLKMPECNFCPSSPLSSNALEDSGSTILYCGYFRV